MNLYNVLLFLFLFCSGLTLTGMNVNVIARWTAFIAACFLGVWLFGK